MSAEVCCSVLDVLDFFLRSLEIVLQRMLLQWSRRDVMKAWIRISAAERERPEARKFFQMKEGCLSDMFDVLVKGEIGKDDS